MAAADAVTAADLQAAAARVVRRPAVRRARVARLPALLALQLQRAVWDAAAGGPGKDGRHVAFPLTLGEEELRALRGEAEGREEGEGGKSEGSGSEGSEEGEQRVGCWRLVAVVVHLGHGAEAGHYIVYRALGTRAQGADVAQRPFGADAGGGPAGATWLRVSDSCVALAEEREVAAARAAVLMYELR